MRLFILIVSTAGLCVITHCYNAQNTVFSKLYNFDNFNDAAASIIETNDGNFLFVGNSSSRNLIAKINSQGDTLWVKQYDLSIGVDNALSVVELANGNFLLAGSLHDTATVTAKGYLMLVNGQGDSLWIKQYGTSSGINGDRAVTLALTPDSGFVVAGFTIIGPSFNTSDAWVFKTDSLGNMLWQKQFDGHGLNDIFEKVIITPDGSIVCAGVTVLNSITSKDYVVKLNQNGDTIWTKEFGGVECGGTLGINNTADGGFIGCGDICVNGRGRARVYKLDSLGNLIWSKDFARSSGDPSEIYNFVSIHEMHDGNFIAAGADYDLTQSQPGDAPRIRMMIVDANGDSLWSQQYAHSTGTTDDDYLFDMKPTSDGGYIMCGYVLHNSPTNNDALVIKVDSIDCINYVNGCQSVGVEETLNLKPETLNFIVYPNPNNGSFTIRLTHPIAIGFVSEEVSIEVYDVFGKQIHYKKTNASTEIQLNLGNIPKGLYLVSITTKKQKEIRKIVVE